MKGMKGENDERLGDPRDEEGGRELGEFWVGAALTLLLPPLLIVHGNVVRNTGVV